MIYDGHDFTNNIMQALRLIALHFAVLETILIETGVFTKKNLPGSSTYNTRIASQAYSNTQVLLFCSSYAQVGVWLIILFTFAALCNCDQDICMLLCVVLLICFEFRVPVT